MSQAGSYENGTILPNVEFLTGNVGGAVGPDALFNINVVGAGPITVTGNALTNTLTISSTGNMIWSREAGAAVPLENNHGYINANAGLTTFALPAVAAVGDIIRICGEGAGGWLIAQNAGQSIQDDNVSSTVGVLGNMFSTFRYNCVELVCRVANTTWSVLSKNGLINVA